MSSFTPLLGMAMVAAIAAEPAAARDIRKGDLVITDAWSRETSPTAKVGAGYLVIRNKGSQVYRLISATTAVAFKVEIHTVALDNGVMRMRRLPNGLEVPAGGAATLAPGGNHIMFIGLRRSLKKGEALPVTLRFARAGTVRMRFQVQSVGAPAPGDHAGRGR